jgi:hypothetical protein
MQQSDFISLIKTNTDKLISGWNDSAPDVRNQVIADRLSIMAILTACYMVLYMPKDEIQVDLFDVETIPTDSPIKELCSLTSWIYECRMLLGDKPLPPSAAKELLYSIHVADSEFKSLPVPVI